MTPELAAAAGSLVVGDSATRVAANAVGACEQLSHHLAKMIGELGIRTLLARSATLTSVRFPWFASAIPKTAPADSPWAALRSAIEAQEPRTARDAFADLMTTFIDLLSRLIGDALVGQLLHELWPELFPSPAKGSP